MYLRLNYFRMLTARAQAGDHAAAVELERELPTSLVHIVRRELRRRTAATSIGRRILDLARQFDQQDGDQNEERLLDRLTQQVCRALIREHTGLEPVHRGMDETVLDAQRPARGWSAIS